MNKSDTWNSDDGSLSWDDAHGLQDCWLADVSGGYYSVTALPSVCGNGYSVCVTFTIEISTHGDGRGDIWCWVDNIAESTVPLDEVREAVERAKSMAEEHYRHGTTYWQWPTASARESWDMRAQLNNLFAQSQDNMSESEASDSDNGSLSWDDAHGLQDCWLADVSGGYYSVTALPSVCGNGYSVCVTFTIEISTHGDGRGDIQCRVDNIAESTVPLDEVREAVERAKSMAEEHYRHRTAFR